MVEKVEIEACLAGETVLGGSSWEGQGVVAADTLTVSVRNECILVLFKHWRVNPSHAWERSVATHKLWF